MYVKTIIFIMNSELAVTPWLFFSTTSISTFVVNTWVLILKHCAWTLQTLQITHHTCINVRKFTVSDLTQASYPAVSLPSQALEDAKLSLGKLYSSDAGYA